MQPLEKSNRVESSNNLPPFLSIFASSSSSSGGSRPTDNDGLSALPIRASELLDSGESSYDQKRWESRRSAIHSLGRVEPQSRLIEGDAPGNEAGKFEALLQNFRKLNALPPKNGMEYIALVKSHATNPSFLQAADKNYFDNYTSSLTTANALHQKFCDLFNGKDLPQYDLSSGTATASLAQLKTAISFARQEFPLLMRAAYGPMQNCLMAHLVQIILCGDKALRTGVPRTPHCFFIKELAIRSNNYSLESALANKSFVYSNLIKIKPEGGISPNEDQVKAKLEEAVQEFVQDCIERSGNSYRCPNGNTISCGAKSDKSCPYVFSEVNKLYGQYLLQNPQITKGLVTKNQSSEFYKQICAIFKAKSLTKDVIQDMLEKHIRNNLKNENIKAKLLETIANAEFPPAQAQRIAEGAKCTSQDVNALMVVKILELMIIMNQSSEVSIFEQLKPILESYKGAIAPNAKIIPHPLRGSNFVFPEKLFDAVEISIPFGLSFSETPDPGDCVEGGEKFIQTVIDARKLIPSISSVENNSCAITGLACPRFHWNASFELMDHFVKQVAPETFQSHAGMSYSQIVDDLKHCQEVFKEISQREPKARLSVSILQPKSPQTAKPKTSLSRLFGASSKAKAPQASDAENLKAIRRYIEESYAKVVSFTEVAAQTGKDPQDVLKILASFRDSLLSAGMALQDMHEEYKQDGSKKDAVDEIDQIIKFLIPNFVKWLPTPAQIESLNEEGLVSASSQATQERTEPVQSAAISSTPKTSVPKGNDTLRANASWIYGFLQHTWYAWRKLNPAQSPYTFAGGTQINANDTMHELRSLLKGIKADSTPKEFVNGTGAIAIPEQFAKDVIRTTRVSVKGQYIIITDPVPSSPNPSERLHLHPGENPVPAYLQIMAGLELTKAQFDYICRFATQAFTASALIALIKLTNAIWANPPRQYWDFERVKDKKGDLIKVVYKSAFCFRDEERDKNVGFAAVRREILIPVSELNSNIDLVPEDQVVPLAKVTETYSALYPNEEDAFNSIA